MRDECEGCEVYKQCAAQGRPAAMMPAGSYAISFCNWASTPRDDCPLLGLWFWELYSCEVGWDDKEKVFVPQINLVASGKETTEPATILAALEELKTYLENDLDLVGKEIEQKKTLSVN